MADHWWGMIIDIDKCIGCGNCVRACSKENDVPEGYFRTWVERYQVTEDQRASRGRFAQRRHRWFPACHPRGHQELLRPQALQPLRRFPVRAGLPGGRHLRQPGWRGAGGSTTTAWAAAIACRPAPTAAAICIPKKNTVDKCTLCYHRITKGLTTACCENCPTGARQLVDFKNPKDPVHEFLRNNKVQVLKPQMATGAKVYYKDLDGSVR